ncbi:undecaprenyldiphospho-muramoylpentapeptide beta-N-acetylglucosaminyltransferase [Thalassotalea aquiviva]|uniref:undecaprenyldiphospho-muramoylpentapeptide beta-N-acetylglucosaminyltransferase n=1 Tax=Thalassotalea aquiviva TaxID=3242415 RepID=UPI003529FD16
MTISKPTLLVMAGGTGGHIFPGLAVAQELQQQGWQVHWLGTPERMEAQVVPKYDIPISFINIKGLRGKGLSSWLWAPFKMLNAVWQSIKILKQVKPDVVLGMGGYASAPGGVAAWLTGVPLVLHEQNAVAGMSNRYLAKFATQVLSAFPGAFNNDVPHQVVGNPVRQNIATLNKAKSNGRNVLIVGGSLGAKVLNDTLPETLALCPELALNIRHQTGAGNSPQVKAKYLSLNVAEEKIQVDDFIDDMASAYQWADLVICRAGALTVSELALAATPAIFVPLPHAVDDHQTENARFLVDQDAAILLPQYNLSANTLVTELKALFESPDKLVEMAENCHKAAAPEATLKVANACQALVIKNE